MALQTDIMLNPRTFTIIREIISANQAVKLKSDMLNGSCDPTSYSSEEDTISKRKRVAGVDIESVETMHRYIFHLRNKADCLAMKNSFEKAIKLYTCALRLCDRWQGVEVSLLASLYHNRAASMIALGRYDDALPDCNEAIKLEGAWVKPYYLKASALQGVGRHREALRFFSFLAKARPEAKIELPGGLMLGANATKTPQTILRHKDLTEICVVPQEKFPKLPRHWIARESRLRPGQWFFENLQTKVRQWQCPVIDFDISDEYIKRIRLV